MKSKSLSREDILSSKIMPFTKLKSSIGELALYGLSSKEYESLLFDKSQKLDSATPEEFVARLFTFSCFPIVEVGQNSPKPESPILTIDKAKELTSEEFESIAKLIIENDPMLYREYSYSKPGQSNNIIDFDSPAILGHVVHHKGENESYTSYLFRLYKYKIEEADSLRIVNGVLSAKENWRYCTEDVLNSLSETALAGDELRRALGDYAHPESQKNSQQEEISPFSLDTRTRIESAYSIDKLPINPTPELLQELITLAKASAKFQLSSYETEIKVLETLQKSSKDAKDSSDANTKFTKIVIGLTVLGIFFNALAIALTCVQIRNSNSSEAQLNLFYGNIIDSLTKVNDTIEANYFFQNISESMNSLQNLRLSEEASLLFQNGKSRENHGRGKTKDAPPTNSGNSAKTP